MQNTISKKIQISGIGIHSGKTVIINLLPCDTNTGIVFRTIEGSEIKARFDNVHTTHMSTKLANKDCSIDVVEHLMAALWSTNIDNLIIEVDNIEIPICDGSSIDWIREIKSAGILQQSEKRRILIVEKTLEVREEDKYVIISPNENPGIIIDLSIDFENKIIGKQRITFDSNKDSFEEGFGSARTFGFVKDLEYLHSKGFGLGASLDNCIGVSEDGIANPEGLRFKDECVRHKVLDCIGDLFLSGYYMNCKVEAYKTGHKMNNMILQKLFEVKSNYLVI